MHGQFFSLVSADWLAAGQPDGGGSVAGRIALVGIALLAVGAFAVLQISNRSDRRRPPSRRRRRRYDPPDWRTLPPPYWPAGRGEVAPPGHEENDAPDWRYGYLPGYGPYPPDERARSPRAARDDAARGSRPLSGPGQPPGGLPNPDSACLRYSYQ